MIIVILLKKAFRGNIIMFIKTQNITFENEAENKFKNLKWLKQVFLEGKKKIIKLLEKT